MSEPSPIQLSQVRPEAADQAGLTTPPRWPRARENHGRSAGGVDVRGSSKKKLMERAARLDIRGRSKMNKQELGEAIARKQD